MSRKMNLGSHGGFWEFYCEGRQWSVFHNSAHVHAPTCKIRKRASAKGCALNLARAILKRSTPFGFTLIYSGINPGGIAVEGEASAWYRRDASPDVFVYASLSGNGRGFIRRESLPWYLDSDGRRISRKQDSVNRLIHGSRATRYGANHSLDSLSSLHLTCRNRRTVESRIREIIQSVARDSFGGA